ncbi:MAG: hypothetical protein JST93_21490 [Acidobacteria bacterium]|nr:hypothetical protein [Acidobacteriota bacterium]
MAFPWRILPLACLCVLGACNRPHPQTVAVPEQEDWFRVTLGVGDSKPVDWSGSWDAAPGRSAGIESIRFDKEDAVKADSWKCSTRMGAVPNPQDWFVGALHVLPSEMKVPKPVLVPNAVYAGARGAHSIRIFTLQGEARFDPASAPYAKAIPLLNGRITVERVPQAILHTQGDEMEDDYPAIAVNTNGAGWVAWTGYQKESETLFAARTDATGKEVIAKGEFFRPVLAADAQGRFFLAVSVHETNTWKIAVARFENGKWTKLETISEGGPDLHPRAVVDAKGQLWVVWQGFREGRSRILARSMAAGKWSDVIAVSGNTANAWYPAIAADAKGGLHFAWDAYDGGMYNVYYRTLEGAQQRVRPSENFQAHASLACDRNGDVWLAFDQAGPNWGKDTGFLVRKNAGTRLYETRDLKLLNLTKNQLAQLPAGHFEQAQLAVDPKGNLCALVRRREVKLHEIYSQSLKRNRQQQYSMWDYAVIAVGGDRAISLRGSTGRNDLRAAISASPAGVAVAWAGDGRTYAKPYPFVKNNVYSASIVLNASYQPQLKAWPAEPMEPPRVHASEEQNIATVQKHRIPWSGKQLRIVRGDMHRHTDISFDGDIDGSIWDFYRYTIDAAGFDYSALTDHNAGDDNEYFWWIIQKSNDLFHYPQRFTPVYAYERSLRYPNGHRNLLWAKRGVKTLVRSAEEEAGAEGAAKLYDYLRKSGGIAMSHTTGTLMGTDWRDNDQDLEPLVEIYQGDRMSYEHEGAPRAPKASDKLTQPGGFRAEGYVWNAWAKGYKLGVQASSDHASTHISYAMLLAEDLSREGLLRAIRARHAYAATDNILLDVRVASQIQGDIFQLRGKPKLEITIEGTAPVERVEVIKNNQYVFESKPGTAAVKLSYEDSTPGTKQNYYYVRVLQQDGQIAWSGPMWITSVQ